MCWGKHGVDRSKSLVHGTVIGYKREWRWWHFMWRYLVKLDDGREAWFWEDDLEKEDS
jgi:hypothetical protein